MKNLKRQVLQIYRKRECRQVVIAIGIIVVMIMSMFTAAIIMIRKQSKRTDPEYFHTYMQQPGTNFSFSLKHNGNEQCSIREHQKMPLASTVKLIIAVEFARQISEGQLNKNEQISLTELDLYYIPNTDGGAHPEWLSQVKQKQLIHNDHVKLIEVAKGMMAFSSNANTEYLLRRLGLDAINQQLALLNLRDHDDLYHFCAAVMIPAYLEEQCEKGQVLDKLTKMSHEEYVLLAGQLADELADGKLQELKQKVMPMSENLQRIWSDRLPRGTTSDYLHLLEFINQKTILPKNMQAVFDEIVETAMTNPRNQTWLKHAGQKGGSTKWVFTLAAYFTDHQDNTIELVFFSNDLEPLQLMKLQENANEFMVKIVKDQEFLKACAKVNREYVVLLNKAE